MLLFHLVNIEVDVLILFVNNRVKNFLEEDTVRLIWLPLYLRSNNDLCVVNSVKQSY